MLDTSKTRGIDLLDATFLLSSPAAADNKGTRGLRWGEPETPNLILPAALGGPNPQAASLTRCASAPRAGPRWPRQ
jgi:hypothetical protein